MHRIDRYLFSQMLFPFVLNILFFTFLFLITQILEIADLVVNYDIGLFFVGGFMACAAPFFLQFTIPMSVMVAVLVTFLRLSGDREIIALKAGGYTLWRLLPPVLVFGVLAAFLTASMTFFGLPWGKLESRRLLTELAVQHGSLALKPMVFNTMLSGVTLYVGEIDRRSGALTDVFIEDNREEGMGTVMAPRGRLQIDSGEGLARLQLFQGMILQGSEESRETETHAIFFEDYDLTLVLARESGEALVRKKKDKEEMYFNELREYIQSLPESSESYRTAVMKFHEKFSLPVACLALGILAFSLGVNSLERRRVSGIGNGLLAFLLYYVLLAMGWSFGEGGVYPPGLAMWIPNLVAGLAGCWLLIRAAAEKTVIPHLFRVGRTRGWKR